MDRRFARHRARPVWVRPLLGLIVVLGVIAAWNHFGKRDTDTPTADATTTEQSAPAEPGTPTSGASTAGTNGAPAQAQLVSDAKAKIDGVKTVDAMPDVKGYDRSCSEGHNCVFGPAWTDDQNAPSGHNGCDTRNDVLAQQLRDAKFKGKSKCIVVSGTYTEPYFGTEETFTKGEPQKSQDEIDHVIPLAAIWRLGGGDAMPLEKRMEIANDTEYNLVLSTNAANASGHDVNGDDKYDVALGEYPPKSAKTAAEWLPYITDSGRACDYGARYVLTADRYDLPILTADKVAISKAFQSC